MISAVPQRVPSHVCLSCRVCCHFPEADSFLRPYFTEQEIAVAVKHGLDPASFPDPRGSQIRVMPDPSGEGFLCPAYEPATSRCRIYEYRPLDCQLYPLAVMWNADRTEVVLGWDTKCPFQAGSGVEESRRSLEQYAERVANLLEQEDRLEVYAEHPRLIGPFQEDVSVLRSLPRLTERVRAQSSSPVPSDPAPRWHPLTLQDRERFERALSAMETPLAAYAFAPHFIWRGILTYWWAEIESCLCLFAEQPDGIFMPLPPLGPPAGLARALAQAFALMRERNRGSAVTRVENLPEALKPMVEAQGYRVRPKDPDYLYRTRELVALAGDRYKSQRAAWNRFVRTQRFQYRPYQPEDRHGCEALYRRWAAQKRARGLDAVAQQMLSDAESSHREIFSAYDALGLVGRVVRVDGTVCAYTFGYPRPPSVFCVLVEVADRGIPGLAQFLFREFCREAAAAGYEWINTMDDAGLPGLARSKMGYRPAQLVQSYIATEFDTSVQRHHP